MTIHEGTKSTPFEQIIAYLKFWRHSELHGDFANAQKAAPAVCQSIE
jgi:hypothetical protein